VEEHQIKTILFGGDFFDNRNSIGLNEIDYVQTEFVPALERSGAHMYAVPGNHDVAYRNTNRVNSLSILKNSPNVTVFEDELGVIKTGGKTFVMCPWINDENRDELLEDLLFYAGDDHIVFGHFEIEGALMYKNSKACEHGIDPVFFAKFHKVLSGHFHHPSTYGNIEYIGAVFHLNWQDYNDWRGFHVYDPQVNEFEHVENEFCLFTELQYGKDLLEAGDDDIETLCEGQIVRIVIDEDYDRVELKDLVARVENCKPVSVDIVDNTIVDASDGDETNWQDNTGKELGDYVEEFLADSDKKQELATMFNRVYDQAKQAMNEVE
jgi:DNA repair exonuclease SbcCD nuclease subunit